MDIEPKTEPIGPQARTESGGSRRFAGIRRGLGNLALSTRLYVLAGSGLAVWAFVVIALLVQEQEDRKLQEADRRVFADLIESSFALRASLDKLGQLFGSEASEARVATVQQVQRHADGVQRHILKYRERHTPSTSIISLFDNVKALRQHIASDNKTAYGSALELLADGAIYANLIIEERIVVQALEQKLASTRNALVLVIGIGVLLMGFGTVAAIRLVTRPLEELHDDTKLALSRFTWDPNRIPRREEVDRISTAFREMTDRLDDATLSVNHLGEIISALSIGLLVTDGAGRIQMVNSALKAMAGQSGDGEELIGLHVAALFGDEFAAQLKPNSRNMSTETILKSAKGRPLPVMVVSTTLPESATFAGVVCATIDLSERKQAEERVRAGRERIESLVQHMHEIQEIERRRIAKDLHDDLGAVLTALRNGLVRLSKLLGTNVAGEATGDLVELADRANTTVDRVLKNLWPQMLDHFGLSGSLEALAAEFEHAYGIRMTCDIDLRLSKPEKTVELSLYRASQEALTNIAKHAHARSGHISLENQGMVTVLKISDDGHGFVKRDDRRREGYGLLGMRQRIAGVGGTVSIDTGVNGSTVTITVPENINSPDVTEIGVVDSADRRGNDKSSAS